MRLAVLKTFLRASDDSVATTLRIAKDVPARASRLKQTSIAFPMQELTLGERKALTKLIEASDLISEIFLRQVCPSNVEIRNDLGKTEGGLPQEALQYLQVNFGPWDRLSGNEPFVGEKTKPPGAGFYPEDMTKDEFQKWIKEHPNEKTSFTSPYTVIRRSGSNLVANPYSQEYREFLVPAAELLKQAAEIAENESLRRFLRSRAEAFLADDYFRSDMDWMDLDSALEVTIGPYEVYEDGLFGYKAAFEAFITINDPAESARVQKYSSLLPKMELNLPIPNENKNTKRGTESPIGVADEIYTGGDARKGIQISAFNLPNDERVREAKGSKKVLLKNVMEAKFRSCLQPIADILMSREQLKLVTFEAYFDQVLFHELSHGLGPGIIVGADGIRTEVRMELRDLYSTVEEAKADVVGLWNVLYMIDTGLMRGELENEAFVTYTAGHLRAARFGLYEAHGAAVTLQFNFLREEEAISLGSDGRFLVNEDRMEDVIRTLASELLTIEAEGDYVKAREFLGKYANASPELEDAMQRVAHLPIDIAPVYEVAKWIDASKRI